MEFNAQNQMPNPGAPMGDNGKKANPLILIVAAIAVLGLIGGAYWYMRGWGNDYYPPRMMVNDYQETDKIATGEKSESTDAGPEIILDQDNTSDIQSDLDQTMVEDVDKQFMDIDEGLQSL